MKLGHSKYLRNVNLLIPLLSIAILVSISLILGVFYADFYTKGEPREAIVAQTIMETGNYILPSTYGGEFAYKPPMYHWLTTLVSTPIGAVTEWSSRLPSALSLVILSLCFFIFIGNRLRFRQSYLAIMLLITSFEVHRSAISGRVDMLLTMFTVLTLIMMYKWEDERGLSGLPWLLPLLISAGFLTKGPVTLGLPLLIFVVYLILLRKYTFKQIIKPVIYLSITSSLLPMIWYVSAWRIGGDDFLYLVYAENFMRLLHIEPSHLSYPLGHDKPFYYTLVYFSYGFVPWILALPFYFYIKRRPNRKGSIGVTTINAEHLSIVHHIPKVHFFSLVVTVVTLLFYLLPYSKRSVYLLPIYPFLSVLMAYILIRLMHDNRRPFKIFSLLIGAIALLFLVFIQVLKYDLCHSFISPLLESYPESMTIVQSIQSHHVMTSILSMGLIVSILGLLYQAHRNNYTKLMYFNIMIVFMINLMIDGPISLGFKEDNSARTFAAQISPMIKDKGEVYGVCRLNEGYLNLYGLSFYTNIRPHNFDTNKPNQGYLMIWDRDYEKFIKEQEGIYHFEVLATDDKKLQEGGHAMLVRFNKQH